MFILHEKIAPPLPLFDDRLVALKKLADQDEDRWVSQFIDDLGRIVRPMK